MAMRMQELTERSGLPRTTIHHYAREGLLPPARKTAKNAAEYDEAHVERLELITRLRREGGDAGALSIPEIRLVLDHLEADVELAAAIRLVTDGIEARPPSAGRWMSAEQLAEAADVAPAFVAELVSAGLVGGGTRDGFGPGDLLVARACETVCTGRGVDPADLTPLADLIREVGNYSATLVEVHSARADEGPSGVSPPSASALRPDLGALCDALLWRSFHG